MPPTASVPSSAILLYFAALWAIWSLAGDFLGWAHGLRLITTCSFVAFVSLAPVQTVGPLMIFVLKGLSVVDAGIALVAGA